MIKRILRHPTVRKHARQGAGFIAAGCLGASIDFSVLALQVEYFGIDPHIAFIPSGLAAVTIVFFFNKYVTFKSREGHARQGMRFAIVYSLAFGLNYAIASGLYSVSIHLLPAGTLLADKAYLAAKAIAIACVAFFNYYCSHAFIFKPRHPVPLEHHHHVQR